MKFILFIILLFIFSFVQQNAYAQSTSPSPIFYCVGTNPQPPCATIAPSKPAAIIVTPTIYMQSPVAGNSSQQPSVNTTSVTPSKTPPCISKPKNNKKNDKDSDSDDHASSKKGAFQQLLQLLTQLFQLLSRLFGIKPSNPCPTPTPTPSISPSLSVSPSNAPSNSPSQPPSPSNPSPSKGPSASPSKPPKPPLSCVNSLNWSGYVATPPSNAKQVYVSSNWKVSSISCKAKPYGISEWVGISNSKQWISQLGNYNRCINGKPIYFGFTEAFPGPVVGLKFPVKPGDKISAHTEMTSPHNFQTTVTDATQGWSFSTPMKFSQNFQAVNQSEVIIEDEAYKTFPLPNFSTTTFTNNIISINNNKATTPMAKAPGLVCWNVAQKDSTSALTGSDFSITFKHN